MLDFLTISTKLTNRGVMEVYPTFKIDQRNDLMTRGSDFYAVWMEDEGLWSTNEVDALHMIDLALDNFAEQERKKSEHPIKVLHCCESSTRMVDAFHQYCKKQLRDQSHTLDQKLTFSNQKTKKRDYASKRLPYPLEEGSFEAYDRLMSVLYSESEREKIEWAIGSIVAGESPNIHKFVVLYGAPGTGKSTVIKIIQQLFDGYCSPFVAKALTSSNDAFALEAFKNNPLVAFEDDSDLSRIEDNTRLNSLVSHELMTVNEKFKSMYTNRFNSFLFMGTNKPVKITDMKSGVTRRLIDVTPTGNVVPRKEYDILMKQIKFELGAIAYHCKELYLETPNKYDNYLPITMLGASNDFYNFMSDSYYIFLKENGTTWQDAWTLYNQYCEDARVPYPFSQRVFKEELKNYFEEVRARYYKEDGTRVRNYYYGFKKDKFEEYSSSNETEEKVYDQIEFKVQKSIFDEECEEYPAQYATMNETPKMEWGSVKTKLCNLDTRKLHYVLVPENHIVIDFDIPDENGEKSFEKNLEAASKWPKTYAELSKSGKGIHLHYIYTGDPSKLAPIYEDHVEIKVFGGKKSLRRKLTKCNNLPIAFIHSGLPLKGETKKVVDQKILMNDAGIRTFIKRCMQKEYPPHSTKSNVDYIYKKLEEAYASGEPYDVTDLKADVINFAAQSSHQAEYCLRLVSKMQFHSENEAKPITDDKAALIFYDVEVFPNLLLINYKLEGEKSPVVRMINPQPEEVKELCRYNLVGFNCRRYDNHILAARMEGRSLKDIYNISQAIVNGERGAFFKNAYNISYTDVYDFSSKKQSLKKWEIELGIHHVELGLPWDQPVPEKDWIKVAEYCDNDVISTEAVFHHLIGDWTARLILADVAGLTPNDTTNTLTKKIIFGDDNNPQKAFNYRNLGDESAIDPSKAIDGYDIYTSFDSKGRPIFPGYKFENGKSTYRGEDVGEGGWVYANVGLYGKTITYDIASMHPTSVITEELFGPVYTKRFKDILDARIAIKHEDFDAARKMLNGALARHLTDEKSAKNLSQALKIAINSVYGLTSAKFDNAFRDPRNKDNIVAKRGALFMINLKNEVEKRGYTVVHVKTDSIKVADPDEKIQNFIFEYGKMYGYTFEIEHSFEKICLVNDAVYVGKLDIDDPKEPGKWTATGKQFQVPYVFKLFTKEPIKFEDACETMSVNTALYLDMNEGLPEGEHNYRFIGKVGLFTPMKPGCGAGVLLRQGVDKNGNVKYDAATGSKGYLWMESEMVKALKLEKFIDWEYYEKQVTQAKNDISELAKESKYGDLEWFIYGTRSPESKQTKEDLEMAMIMANAVPW